MQEPISRTASDKAKVAAQLRQIASYLREHRQDILQHWEERARCDEGLGQIAKNSRQAFLDHLPQVLDLIEQSLRQWSLEEDQEAFSGVKAEMARHGLHRWQQGVDLTSLVRDWNSLRSSILFCVSRGVEENPGWASSALSEATVVLSEVVGAGIDQSAARFEELRQSEARSHLSDLQATLDLLQSLATFKESRYAEATHDLKSNLQMLMQVSKALQKRRNGAEERELDEIFDAGIEASLRLLKEFEYYVRLESGTETAQQEETNVSALLGSVGSACKALAEERGLRFSMEGPESLTLVTDPAKVARIAQNLILNAIKYTKEGEVSIEWSQSEETWRIIVRNCGELVAGALDSPLTRKLLRVGDLAEEAGDAGGGGKT